MQLKKQFAFTLSEVLITIGVLGVVAALTMPTLMASYKKQVYVTQLKKSISVFEQGFQKRMADIECTDLNCGGINELLYPNTFDAEIKKNFDIVMSCPMRPDCMPKDKSGNPIKYKYLSGAESTGIESYSIFMTKDGAIFGLRDTYCAPIVYRGRATFDYNCGFVYIDVNGAKGPNQWGRDAFYFALGENAHLYASNSNEWSLAYEGDLSSNWINKSETCQYPSSTSTGLGCGARIMANGWKMDY